MVTFTNVAANGKCYYSEWWVNSQQSILGPGSSHMIENVKAGVLLNISPIAECIFKSGAQSV